MSEVEFYVQLISLESSLKKFAYRLTQKNEEAKDLFQDTCLRVLLNRDKFTSDENFKAWTFTIMKNTFITDYRNSFRQRTMQNMVKESYYNKQEEYSVSGSPDSSYSVKEISQNIEQLHCKFKTPFKMYIQGYKYKEIADKLNINIGTVKSRIFLSRKQLMLQVDR
jgi:RNA polymerase sigma-70 factor (ECF subfamily)